MPGPYDYTVNIPQPPAQNFLQSLMGIQQLKGLQQQGEIAQQQAQYQSQMQPLQIQAEQARIGQIGASTSATEEALRQSKITFEQQQQDRVRQLQEQADAREQTKQLFGELQSLPASASLEDITKITNKLALVNPSTAKQVLENFSKLSEQYQNNAKIVTAQAGALLEAGKNQKAADLYNEAARAVEDKAGNNQALLDLAKGYKIQASLALSNPVGAKMGVTTLLGVLDPKALDSITAAKKEVSESPLKAAQARLAEADATLKELEATGALDSEKKMKQENAMRENFQAQPLVRNYLVRKDNYDIIKTADNSPEGDRARITAFIKLHDPNSVVSVTESGQLTSTTPNAQYQSWIARINDKGILGDDIRKSLNSQADKTMQSAESQFNSYKNNTAAIAKRYGLNPRNVIELFDAPAPTETDKITGTPDLTGFPKEEARIRNTLRPAAGFGNTMTPSTMQSQGSTVGLPPDVDSILKKFGVK